MPIAKIETLFSHYISAQPEHNFVSNFEIWPPNFTKNLIMTDEFYPIGDNDEGDDDGYGDENPDYVIGHAADPELAAISPGDSEDEQEDDPHLVNFANIWWRDPALKAHVWDGHHADPVTSPDPDLDYDPRSDFITHLYADYRDNVQLALSRATPDQVAVDQLLRDHSATIPLSTLLSGLIYHASDHSGELAAGLRLTILHYVRNHQLDGEIPEDLPLLAPFDFSTLDTYLLGDLEAFQLLHTIAPTVILAHARALSPANHAYLASQQPG